MTAFACIVNRQLTMRGGYSAADWTTSLPTLNPTRLDGENLRRVLVVERTSTATALVLENVEIIRGYGTHRLPPNAGDALTFGFGGGIDAVNSTLTLRGVTFADCRVVGENGAGPYAGAASGGALSARASGAPAPLVTLESVRFLRNVAEAGDNTGASGRGGYAHGGAICASSSTSSPPGSCSRATSRSAARPARATVSVRAAHTETAWAARCRSSSAAT